jgi:hypothetical protein
MATLETVSNVPNNRRLPVSTKKSDDDPGRGSYDTFIGCSMIACSPPTDITRARLDIVAPRFEP